MSAAAGDAVVPEEPMQVDSDAALKETKKEQIEAPSTPQVVSAVSESAEVDLPTGLAPSTTAPTNDETPITETAEEAAPEKETPLVQEKVDEPVKQTESEVPKPSEPSEVFSTPAPPQPQSGNQSQSAKKSRIDLSGLPTRQYLDQTVVPILLQGLSWLAKTRPEDPITELSKYLIEHKPEHDDTNYNGN